MELSDLKSGLDEQLLAMEDRANSRALQVIKQTSHYEVTFKDIFDTIYPCPEIIVSL